MAKASLKLTGVYDPWARGVRVGVLTKTDGSEARVLVRPHDGWPAELVEPIREEARLISRLEIPGLLKVEYASAISGKPAVVHHFHPTASITRLREEIAPRGQLVPTRAALEIAAAVAETISRLAQVSRAEARYVQPTPTPGDVLVGVEGEVLLTGVRAMRPKSPKSPPTPGYAPPPGADDGGTYGIGALLYEMLAGIPLPPAVTPPQAHDEMVRRSMMRIIARPGDVPGEDVLATIRLALSSDAGARGTPADLGRRLRELAHASRSTPLRTWASTLVPTIPGVLPVVAPPLPAADGVDDEATLAGRRTPAPAPTRLRPPMRVTPAGNRPIYGLPGPRAPKGEPAPLTQATVGPPMLMPSASVRRAHPPATGPSVAKAVTKPSPARAEEVVTPPKPNGPGPVPPRQASGPLPPAPPPRREPVPPAPEPVVRPPDANHGHEYTRPAPAPIEARSSRGGPAIDGPRVSVPIGGAALPDVPPPRRRSETVLTVVLSAGVIALVAVVAVAFFLWRMFGSTPEVEAVPEAAAPVAPMETPGEGTAAVEAPAPEPVAAPTASPPAAPAPVAAPVAAPSPKAAAAPKAAEPVAKAAPVEEADPGDVRIAAKAPAPAEVAATAPVEAPSAGPFRVEFRSGADSITSLEVRCKEGGGTGTSVVVDAAPAGACRVTGRGGEAPIVTQVNVSANRTYTCFAGGSRSCR